MRSVSPKPFGDVIGLDDDVAKPGTRRDGDLRLAGLVARRLGQQIVIGANARLRLRLARLGARPDPVELARQRALARLVLLALDLEPLVLLLEPGGIAAVIGDARAAIELERPFGDVVEEIAVVGDHDHGAGIVAQMMLEPGHAFRVEMVGRLVEQQDVGLGEQQLAQRHAALLAAGQRLDRGIARRAAERVHGLLHLRVEVPQPLGVDLVLERRHLVGGLVGIVDGELVVAVELRLLLGHAFHDVAGHVLGLVEARLLRQIADADAVGGPGLAHELGLLARHDAEQRRLAGAVQAHHADLGAGQEGERDVLQHLLAARIGLGQLVHDIDVLGAGHRALSSERRFERRMCSAFSQSAHATQCGKLFH